MSPITAHYRVDDANVAWRVADDEAVLLHADTSAYFGLNRTATLLWVQIAERPMTPDQLTAWARSSFSGVPDGLPAEVSGFVNRLSELGLIESVESAESPAPAAPPLAAEGAEPPSWESPAIEQFGELEKLILSGE